MYNFVPALNDGLKAGQGASSLFGVLGKRSSNIASNASFDPEYRKVTLPNGDKIPRMHSCWIPAYKKQMAQRELCKIDDGYRLYEKFPVQRAIYRGAWVATGAMCTYTFYRLFNFMVENRP